MCAELIKKFLTLPARSLHCSQFPPLGCISRLF